MKTLCIPIFLVSLLLAAATFADVDTNTTYLKVLQTSNDVHGVINLLPEIEDLWPQEPEAYLTTVKKAADALSSASDSKGKQAFLNLFTNMMQKPFPTNEAQVASWVSLKSETIFYYMNFDRFQNDKSMLVYVARFIGEIRSNTIPNYTNQGIVISGLALDPTGKLQMQLQNELKANEIKIRADEFQRTLRSINMKLTWFLLPNCSRLAAGGFADTNFIQQIASAAHLTKEESDDLIGNSKLNSTRRP